MLVLARPQLLIQPLQPHPHPPRTHNTRRRKGNHRREAHDIPRPVGARPEIGTVDVRQIGRNVNQRVRHRLLFGRLRQRVAHPSENDRTHTVGTGGVEERSGIACGGVLRAAADGETDHSEAETGRDVARPLVETPT